MEALKTSPSIRSASSSKSALEDNFHSLSIASSHSEHANETPSGAQDSDIADPFKDVPVLSRSSAELYLFDTETDVFVIQEKDVQIDIASGSEFESMLSRDRQN